MTDIGEHAVEYARHGWAVFPLRGKVPAITGGRGVLDATTDVHQVEAWWYGHYRGANIGARVPQNMIVVDIDPRHGGDVSLTQLQCENGPLPETLTTVSGRGDGGRHLFYRRPPGRLTAARLGAGIDLKTCAGYTVMAPSIHPDTRQPYTRIDRAVAAPPIWLMNLLTAEPITPINTPPVPPRTYRGPSVADTYSAEASWADILNPHGWRCLDADPDADSARWLHPTATSACSATIRNGYLFVYSPNTPFDVTEPGNPHGYTKFRAYAVLDHGGDMSAAARALTQGTP